MNFPKPVFHFRAGAAVSAPTRRVGLLARAIPWPDRSPVHRACFRVWWLLASGVLVWCLASWSTSAWGQAAKFETYELPAQFTTPEIEKMTETLAKTLVTSRDVSGMSEADRSKARFYLNRYLPWKLTQPENLPIVTPKINEVLDNLARGQRNGAGGATAYLQYTFEGLKVLAEGNYMPAARINAILGLSRLEMRPYDAARSTPPVPLPNSLPVMLAIYENEANSDGVRAAALQGLNRYLKFGFATLTPDQRTKLVTVMKTLLDAPAPEGRPADAHAYLQRFAVDSLALLLPVEDRGLGTQLVSVSGSKDRPDLIALYSAAQLGSFKKGLQGSVDDPQPILTTWSTRAYEVVEAELKRLRALKRPTPATSQPPSPDTFLGRKTDRRAAVAPTMGGMEMDYSDDAGMSYDDDSGMADMMDMMDMGFDDGSGFVAPAVKAQPPEVSLSRRQINHVLQQLLRGATGSAKGKASASTPGGLMGALAPPQRAPITTWVNNINPVVIAINDAALDDRDKWIAALEQQRVALAKLAGIEIKVEAAAEGSPDDPVFDNLPGLFGGPLPAGAPPEDEPAAGLPPMGMPGEALPGAATP